MKRYNQILIGILIIQLILSIAVFWPKKSTAVEGELLFPDVEADNIVALTVSDADGNNIYLEKSASDWILPDAGNYPASPNKINPMLKKLIELTTDRLVTRTDTSHKQLQVAVDEFVRRIDFEVEDGTKHTIYLGSSPRYGAVHFRVDGQEEAYLTSDITTFEIKATADSWVDTAYLSIPQAEIVGMTLENSAGAFVFTHEGDGGDWTMEGLAMDETLNQTQVANIVQQASSVNLTTPLGQEEQADYRLDEPNAVVTLETESQSITLRIGAKDPDAGGYVVASSESSYYVKVSEVSVKKLIESTREDFLQLPPTPTP